MTLALAAIIAAGIAVPHALRLQRASPVTAIALWLSSLALRALATALLVVYVLLYLPGTSAFDAMTHWCWEAFIPPLPDHHAVDGHSVGDLAVTMPALLLMLSFLWASIGILRAARAARYLIERHVLGHGPQGSLIVGGPDVELAVAGVTRPRIVVSAGALARLDDDELAAALDHEQAHIARRHRLLMLVAVGFCAMGRLIPGGGRARRELAFHLERDADRWALRRRHDRLALASVICKAAGAQRSGDVAVVGLGDVGVRQRIGQLLEGDRQARTRRPLMVLLNGLAAGMVACTLLLAAAIPAAAVAGVERDAHRTHHAHHCEH